MSEYKAPSTEKEFEENFAPLKPLMNRVEKAEEPVITPVEEEYQQAKTYFKEAPRSRRPRSMRLC